MPYNHFETFRIACRDTPKDIIVSPAAEKDSRKHYGLKTKKELLEFIGNNGLDDLDHVHIKVWEKNPDRDNNPLDVYDYRCRTNGISCYIAIIFIPTFYGKTKNMWRLKSFHPDKDRQQPLLDKLLKLGFKPSEEEND